jgi:hypothetical protein
MAGVLAEVWSNEAVIQCVVLADYILVDLVEVLFHEAVVH